MENFNHYMQGSERKIVKTLRNDDACLEKQFLCRKS